MKQLILFVWILSLCGAGAGCARNPVTGKRQIVLVSESQEIAMARSRTPGPAGIRYCRRQATRATFKA
jgi:hypothetical protein